MTVLKVSEIPSGPASRHSRRDESGDVRKLSASLPSTARSKRWPPLPVAWPASQTKVAGPPFQSAGTASVSHSTAMAPSEARLMSADEISG